MKTLKSKDPVRVKCGRKSRSKGKRGEREARDLLRKLFYPKEQGKVERTPMSGAWHGTTVMTGDLVFVRDEKFDGNFPLFLEIKNVGHGTVAPYKLLTGEWGILLKWMEETTKKVKKGELLPILMWKVNFSKWFVMMPTETVEALGKFSGSCPFEDLDLPYLKAKGFYLMPFSALRKWLEEWVEFVYSNPSFL